MKNFEFIDSIKFPFPITQMVAWGDMDAFQHVNNVQYFRYFETGRVEFFNKTNLWKLIEAENIRFVVGKLECNYLQELVHPAEIEISVGIKKIGNASLVLHQMVKSDRNIVAHGEAIVVATNPSTGKSTPWTDNIRTAFEKWL
ncbi:MAG: acyl-CoA thioesterase [Chitinophagales bacterium]|jgi:acyl-CoA thioester hydrolase|nr:acyl-CoA thioesterase [Chitinophagales bacterium]HQW68181.1 thioesterase family protein [Flavobacterium sp.]MBP6154931.1 acyl-CoA thioesterase [Chitinophagales bacterium]HQV78944.1 thioesterase family protein [Chitinophagales bacterium]HQW68224.1 thioesterase family protein [Flavobacterium sp.]